MHTRTHTSAPPKRGQNKKRVVCRNMKLNIQTLSPCEVALTFIMESFSNSVFSEVVSVSSEKLVPCYSAQTLCSFYVIGFIAFWWTLELTNTSRHNGTGSWEANLGYIVPGQVGVQVRQSSCLTLLSAGITKAGDNAQLDHSCMLSLFSFTQQNKSCFIAY